MFLGILRRTGDRLSRIPRVFALALAFAWMGMIWSLSSGSAPATPVNLFWSTVSNLVHAPLFGILALWLALVLPRTASRWPVLGAREIAVVLATVLLYGIVDEWHQAARPDRHPSVLDILTDLVGGACTLWVVTYVVSATAGEGGLRARLALGLTLCVGVAMLGPAFG